MLSTCPKCGHDQGVPAAECPKCGIVFAKIKRAAPAGPAATKPGFTVYRAPESNPKRSVLTLLLGMAALAVVVGVVGVVLAFQWARGTEAYLAVETIATTHPVTMEALGEPIDAAKFFVFTMETNQPPGGEATGAASFALPIEGPAGKGTVMAEAQLIEGSWMVTDAIFVHGESGPSKALVTGGRVVTDRDAVSAVDAPSPGLTAAELRTSNVDAWGERGAPRSTTTATAAPAAAAKTPTTRRTCPYTGSRSSSVSTVRPMDMRGELTRSRGCVTLVMVWASWCPACRGHYPDITELADTYRDEGLAFHSFSTDEDPSALEAFLETQTHRRGVSRLDLKGKPKGTLGRGVEDLGVTYPNAIPFYALFDRDGTVLVQGTTNVTGQLEGVIREQML